MLGLASHKRLIWFLVRDHYVHNSVLEQGRWYFYLVILEEVLLPEHRKHSLHNDTFPHLSNSQILNSILLIFFWQLLPKYRHRIFYKLGDVKVLLLSPRRLYNSFYAVLRSLSKALAKRMKNSQTIVGVVKA